VALFNFDTEKNEINDDICLILYQDLHGKEKNLNELRPVFERPNEEDLLSSC
jgi:hypothetical protein